jgi:class 3 adenylate cyclase
MDAVADTWARRGFRIGVGVGIALGYATLGMTGFESRRDYTAMGTVVNLASRLSDEAASGQVLLDLRANDAVERDIPTELIGERVLKGFDRPLSVYRLKAPSELTG